MSLSGHWSFYLTPALTLGITQFLQFACWSKMIICSQCLQHKTGLWFCTMHILVFWARDSPPLPAPSPQPPALCFYREAPTRGSSVETANSYTQNWGQIPAQRLSWEKGRKLRIPWPLFLLWRCGELQAVAKYPCRTIVQKPDSLLFWD